MEFLPWTLFTDLGLIALLLLLGTIIRAKVKLIQRIFLPASIIAGLLGLALGSNGFNIIPFSAQIGAYPGILNAMIFGALPLISPKVEWRKISNRVGRMWSYSQVPLLFMWGAGLLFSLVLLNPIWKDLHAGFGLILAAGFVGGHGTAAAIGDAFSQYGWEEATSLAMTSATVGILSAILIGLVFVKRGSMNGDTKFLSSFHKLPDELRTGLISPGSREKTEMNTVSSMSIDPLIFHASLIFGIAFIAYYLSGVGMRLLPNVAIPIFSVAFLIGLAVRKILSVTRTEDYFSKDLIGRISGGAADLLVAFGIASINLPVVIQYIVPLSILFLFGLFIAWFHFFVLSPRFFEEYWFERGIFTWGWTTGAVAMGIALLRIVDPELKSNTLDDFGLAFIAIAPVELMIITLSPIMVVNSQSWLFIIITLGFTFIIVMIAKRNGWFRLELNTKTTKDAYDG